MLSFGGQIDLMRMVANAIMSQHCAQKCMGECAQAVMSQHCAQKSAKRTFSNRIYYRYC